ncbi:uncharacterized protein LOC134258910 [Saccostrea cucullata]|uniref:uncharacterized protein LOC134258910 n=1 Tax=Saccostrea cuccullata TaxID=36930 RepID=UPI002ED4A412
MYAKSSMISMRFGLQKSFMKSNDIDIVNNEEFSRGNVVFSACLVKIKREGTGEVKHKEIISDGDMKKLYDCGVFNVDNPKTLQWKVFFEIMLHFCNRGRENLRNMEKDDYVINVDADGRRFVVNNISRLTKNHRGDSGDDDTNAARMYEQPGNPNCPVASFEKYIQKLNPECKSLWQRPKSLPASFDPDILDLWYDNMVVGKNTLGKFMQLISKEAKLATAYTNHSIRATCITILDESGYESRHIMGISKHKSETCLKHYSSKLSEKRKRDMSDALSRKIHVSKFHGSEVFPSRPSSSSVQSITYSHGSSSMSLQPTSNAVPGTFNEIVQPVSESIDWLGDVDDDALAAVLNDPMIFANIQEIPKSSVSTVTPYNFHGCTVTINNYSSNTGGQS